MENTLKKYILPFNELLNKNVIAVNPSFVKICGSFMAGALLSQLCYWWPRRTRKSYFYKSAREMEEETGGMSQQEQRTAIKILKLKGFINVDRKGCPPTHRFFINEEVITNALIKLKSEENQQEVTLQSEPDESIKPINFEEIDFTYYGIGDTKNANRIFKQWCEYMIAALMRYTNQSVAYSKEQKALKGILFDAKKLLQATIESGTTYSEIELMKDRRIEKALFYCMRGMESYDEKCTNNDINFSYIRNIFAPWQEILSIAMRYESDSYDPLNVDRAEEFDTLWIFKEERLKKYN